MALFVDSSSWALPVALVLSVACSSSDSGMQAGAVTTPAAAATGAAASPGAAAGGGARAGASGGTVQAVGPAGSGGTVVGSGGKLPGAAGAGGTSAAAGKGGAGTTAGAAGNGAVAGSAGAAGHTVAGSGGAAGAAGTTVAAGSGGAAGSVAEGVAGAGGATAWKPKCKTSPKQVIILGDSYLNWLTHTFPDDIVREAGETWRMYAVGGYSLGSGGLGLIPDELDQAIKEDPNMIAAVLTGGGNDILIADEMRFPGGGECKDRVDSPTVKVCQDIVSTAMEAGKKLMQTAADAGVRDVIYLFYPHIPGGGFGGMNPNYLLDYSLPMARELCEGAEDRTQGKLRCHFIDLVPLFTGHDDWFADDGIHENSQGSAAMAKEVMRVAKDICFAQPASSGCCEP